MRSNVLLLRTPEGVIFSLNLAGPVVRFLAWIIDFFVISGICMIFSRFLGATSVINPDLIMALLTLVYFVVQIGYGILTEWLLRGQTLGKRLCGLRVEDEQGLRLRFSQVVIRNLLRFLDSLPLLYFVGGVTALISSKGQRLGDIAAGTVVVRIPILAMPDVQQLVAGKFNSFRDYPHLEARLRQRVTPNEARLALQALLRRDIFDPAARVELFAELAEHFKTTIKFPDEAVEGLTDEQYVRNVVDTLFRKTTGQSQRSTRQSEVA
jgi:uncharacterized RDD family membrane protein YckC